jgi:uncharacterized protein (DUF885 family)
MLIAQHRVDNEADMPGRLTTEIWRAIRLVVDTGLHVKGWTEAQAVESMQANSAMSQGQIRAEVRRYIVLPGQATAYTIGMIRIQELRARAEARGARASRAPGSRRCAKKRRATAGSCRFAR